MRTFLGLAAVAAASLAVPAAPAHADPVDDALAVVHYVICPFPEVDVCVPDRRFDPTCPVLASVAPAGVPGVVEIKWDGDTYVDGHLVWDCPPYTP